MTFATKITIARLCLVPVFAWLAVKYSAGVVAGSPVEWLRWAAFWVFVIASASDGVDGWIARRFDQKSELGAFLDPIADKALVLTAVVILTLFPWGEDNWRIPPWFATMVILRDAVILAGIRGLWSARRKVEIRPHWTGKACTVSLFVVLGWVMLRVTSVPLVYPCGVGLVFVAWSTLAYIRQGLDILRAEGS